MIRVMHPRRGGRRGGFPPGRDGSGRGRADRGRGGPGGSGNTWKRKEGEGCDAKHAKPIQEPAATEDNSKWEGKGTSDEQKNVWVPKKSTTTTTAAGTSEEGKTQNLSSHEGGAANSPCENCGMHNHATKDCRRISCEICGFNHKTLDCRRCVPWDVGLELCAAQVEDQSFFFIDECIDPNVAKEKVSTTVITVMKGFVNAKQIETEFMNLIGVDGWKWYARQVADDKFLMHFPNVKLASQWSNLKNLTMRNEAQIKNESWTPSIGSKGILQSAWFRVGNIPADQRSIRTLVKVGGLVGKVIDFAEGTRYRYDYVRLLIACRDVARVPRKAEGTLGMEIIDFGFSRELPEDPSHKILKSGIVVSDDQQPPMKKSKTDTSVMPSVTNSGPMSISKCAAGDTGKTVQETYWSAPQDLFQTKKPDQASC